MSIIIFFVQSRVYCRSISECVCVRVFMDRNGIYSCGFVVANWGGRNKSNKQKSGIDERRHGVVKGSKRCIQLLSENKQV